MDRATMEAILKARPSELPGILDEHAIDDTNVLALIVTRLAELVREQALTIARHSGALASIGPRVELLEGRIPEPIVDLPPEVFEGKFPDMTINGRSAEQAFAERAAFDAAERREGREAYAQQLESEANDRQAARDYLDDRAR